MTYTRRENTLKHQLKVHGFTKTPIEAVFDGDAVMQ